LALRVVTMIFQVGGPETGKNTQLLAGRISWGMLRRPVD